MIGEQLVKGQGIGRKYATGKVVVAKTATEAFVFSIILSGNM